MSPARPVSRAPRREGLLVKTVLFVIQLDLTTPPADPSARQRHFRRGESAPPPHPPHPHPTAPQPRHPPPAGSRRGKQGTQVRLTQQRLWERRAGPSSPESHSWPISRSHPVIREPGVGAQSRSASAPERTQLGARGPAGGGHTSSPGTKRPPGPGARGRAPSPLLRSGPRLPRPLTARSSPGGAPASGRLPHAPAGLTAAGPPARRRLWPVPAPAPP